MDESGNRSYSMSGQVTSEPGLSGLTKMLIGLVSVFALVGVVVRFGLPTLAQPPPGPAPVAITGSSPAVEPSPTLQSGSIQISILTTDTKAEWLKTVTQDFNNAHKLTAEGRPILVEILQVSGPEVMLKGVLDGELKPVLWSPGDISSIEQANQIQKDRGKDPIVKAPKSDCPAIVYVPVGFATWRPMAEALGWPAKHVSWETIIDLAGDPRGWAKYGHPEWGQFKFGHSHPGESTSGFNILTSLAYYAAGKTEGLTPDDVRSPAVVEAFRKLEQNTYHYGTSTSQLLGRMTDRGAGYLHAAATSETSFIYQVVHFGEKLQPQWAFIFPAEGVFWSDNPTCIVQAPWVSEEQQEAAGIYRDFLLAPAQQEKAVQIGLRPANPDVALHCPVCLDNGTDPAVSTKTVPPLAGVSGPTREAVIDTFKRTKKSATVALLLDTSETMTGSKIKNAVEGAAHFLTLLERNDEILAYKFDREVLALQPSGRIGDVEEELSSTLKGLYADRSTKLYDAVCTAAAWIEEQRQADRAAGEARLYGMVVLSDGNDTGSEHTESEMFACLPSGEEVDGIKVYTIAYGDDANKDLLARIAKRTNGAKFDGNPDNIEQIYLKVSAEQ